MSEHTKEPWRINYNRRYKQWNIFGLIEKGRPQLAIASVYSCDGERSPEETESNARRIVACVNACAGMDDPESQIRHLKNFCNPRLAENADAILEVAARHVDERLALIKQRNALLAQLKAVNELFESGDWSVTRGDGRMTLPYEQAEKVAEDVEKLVQENEA